MRASPFDLHVPLALVLSVVLAALLAVAFDEAAAWADPRRSVIPTE